MFTLATLVHAAILLAAAPQVARTAPLETFCEHGFAVSLEFGTGGAVWAQEWGLPSAPWFDCQAQPNTPLFNKNVAGIQRTVTSGAPVIDENLILHLPFAGEIVWSVSNQGEANTSGGEIVGRMEGIFVADLNAARAEIGEDTIIISFGQSLHDAPDAIIQVTDTSGKFQSIQAVGDWAWRVEGTVAIARVPELNPQVNIFAALMNPALLVGAEEEVVLFGQFMRGKP